MTTQVLSPFPFFTARNGTPLNNGYIYIGEADQDPETNPAPCYFDAEMTIPAEQPLRTQNGYIVNGSTPTKVYTPATYSIRVRASNGTQIFYVPRASQSEGNATVVNDIDGLKAQLPYGVVIVTDQGVRGVFFWTAGDFTGLADDVNVVESDTVPLSEGAWVRQMADSVGFSNYRNTFDAIVSNGVNVLDYGYIADALFLGGDLYDPANWSGTDNTAAIQAAIDDAIDRGVGAIDFPPGSALFSDPIIDGVLFPGLTFRGVGPNGYFNSTGTGDGEATRLLYWGDDTAFKITAPYGSASLGSVPLHLTFEHMSLGAIQRSASFFDFNDATGTHVTSPSTSPYSVLLGLNFINVRAIKNGVPDADNTGDFIRANKVFSMYIDPSTYISGWRRGVWLRCCDVGTLAPNRMELNGRHYQLEAYETFGNDMVIDTRFLGPVWPGHAEDPFCVHDAAIGTRIGPSEVESGDAEALFYFNGNGTYVAPSTLQAAKLFYLDASAKYITLDTPLVTVANMAWAPTIADPASWDAGNPDTNYSMTILGASSYVRAVVGISPRVRYPDGWNTVGYISQHEQMIFDAGGMRPAGHEFSIRNPTRSQTAGSLASGGIAGWASDASAYGSSVWRCRYDVPNSGMNISLKAGIDVMPGDVVTIKTRVKTTNSVSGGWALSLFYNGALIGSVVDLPESAASLTFAEGTVDLGVATPSLAYGDTVAFTLFNVAANGDLYGEYVYCGVSPADPPP